MTKKPAPKKMIEWNIFYLANKQKWMGVLEASSEEAAIAAGAVEYNKPATKLMALRKGIGL